MWRNLRHHWDILSLVAGFLLGLGFQVFLKLLQIAGRRAAQAVHHWRQSLHGEASGRFAHQYRRWLRSALRGWHLAAPLFALEEILQPPRLLPPPLYTVPEGASLPEDIVTLTVPYSPEWPEMSAYYQAPTLTLPEALSQGAHLLLTGAPGTGKTTALLALAWAILQRQEEVAFLGSPLPFYFHVAGVVWDLPAEENLDPTALLAPLIQALPSEMPESLRAKLVKVLPSYLENGQSLLLVDGLDELPLAEQKPVAAYLRRLLETYPNLRFVAAAAPDFFDGLTALGLTPMTMAPWNARQALRFLEQWGRRWENQIAPTLGTAPPVDALLLNQWLLVHRPVVSPLELTLHAWAAYAGDLLGRELPQAVEAYLRRVSPEAKGVRPALQSLALELLAAGRATLPEKRIGRSLPLEPSPEETTAAGNGAFEAAPSEEDGGENEMASAEVAKGLPSAHGLRRLLPELLASGILSQRGEEIGFAHPILWAYLAGQALGHAPRALSLKPGDWWAVKTETLRFAVALGAGAEMAATLAQEERPPLFRGPRWAARALPHAPSAPWKVGLLRRLAGWLADPLMPLGLRADALVALTLSGEQGLGALFRRLLTHRDPSVRRLAALGCGLVQDTKATALLQQALDDEQPEVQRAAMLALVALDTEEALTAVAERLITGNDLQRRSAAEALANHPREGHPILQEGAQVDDLLVRRAVVYGLVRIKEPWARELLARLQVEDDEWVVRNAAAQGMEALNQPSPFIPRPRPPLHDEPWLLAFAAEQGLGVPPGEGAFAVLRQCLREGNEEQVLAALERIVYHPEQGWWAEVLFRLEEGTAEQKEAALLALRYLAATGSTP